MKQFKTAFGQLQTQLAITGCPNKNAIKIKLQRIKQNKQLEGKQQNSFPDGRTRGRAGRNNTKRGSD